MWRVCGSFTVVLLLLGCVQDPGPVVPPTQPPVSANVLRIALDNSPLSIDPRFVRDDEGEQIVDALFDPLVRLDHAFRVVPAAAARWEIDDEGLRYTFHLRPARFHDGTPVTADDFVRTFHAIADGTRTPRSYLDYLLRDVAGITASRRFGAPLAGVRALDERTLEITLRQPRTAFLEVLTDPSLVPLPQAADTDPDTFRAAPIGNGPFQLVGAYEPGTFLRLARNETYFEPARIDEIIFTIFANDPSREAQWRSFVDGQVHIAYLPPRRLPEAGQRYGAYDSRERPYGVVNDLTSTVYLYAIDSTVPPFDDVRARQALSLAIDRSALATDVMGNTRVAATSFLPPVLPGALQTPCSHCVPDTQRAIELFSEATVENDGETAAPDDRYILTLLYPRGAVHTLIAERLAVMIEDVLPITVRLRAVDSSGPMAYREVQGPAAIRLGWRSNVTDPAEYFEPIFGTDFSPTGSLSGVANSAIDEALDVNRRITSAPIRQFLYQQLERQLLDEAVVLPILWYRHERIIASDVENASISPFGRVNVRGISVADAL